MTTAAPVDPLALLRRLEWRVRHAVENVVTGEYRSAFRGRGMEFDQVVRYEFGDDVRDIDWNVTARLGEPYRKKFVEEREVTLVVVLEDSPSLQFGSAAVTKREALLELAGFVMLLGAVNRDRVGFLHLAPSGHTFSPPSRGRGAIHHAAARLLGLPPPALDAGPACALPAPLLLKAAPKHSIVLWLGDFSRTDAAASHEVWPLLQRRYQTMGFRIDDPWERDWPALGHAISVYDPLSGEVVPMNGSAAERKAHAQWRAAREAAWIRRFPDPLSRLALTTRDNRLDALVAFFHRRMAAR
ncbi:DUF58 domain-containing protein [Nibricoccus sp. IMCC34717]|uniref:DUF58 domain-containing protein n=1 Tax=Nibricoccus sp. IMCC34717 TaxID=3034021 RepID=UPI00384B6280